MSRWLTSVNSLLEQLDGQVETAIDERGKGEDEDELLPPPADDAIESILSKRGLSNVDNSIEEGKEVGAEKVDTEVNNEADEYNAWLEEDIALEEHEVPLEEVTEEDPQPIEEERQRSNPIETEESSIKSAELLVKKEPAADATSLVLPTSDMGGLDDIPLDQNVTAATPPPASSPTAVVNDNEENSTDPKDVKPVVPKVDVEPHTAFKKAEPDALRLEKKEPSPKAQTSEKKIPSTKTSVPPPHSAPISMDDTSLIDLQKEYKDTLSQMQVAQKETRTLRRHVVALNEELETAEAEIKAQRTELERAAERMEKDRIRNKEEKESAALRQKEEIKALKAQHDIVLKEHKARADQQLEDSRQQLREMEARRMAEGGNFSKELEVAIQREQETSRRCSMIEDEKSTLLAQVSSLQAQLSALENRVDNLSQTADNAMEREREAEDKLDATLSLHARQLSQRQTRESELERTIADLGAALVVARNKEANRLNSEQKAGASSDSGDPGSLSAKLSTVEDELETTRAQLKLERQRAETMQEELVDMSRERTEEASVMHARQMQSDRQLADLYATVARLESNARDSIRKDPTTKLASPQKDDADKDKQIQTLSEQLFRHQDKLGKRNSEIKALKSRLQAALTRADQAEEMLATDGREGDMYDEEMGGIDYPRQTMRKRGRAKENYGGSIRSALRIDAGRSENTEKIANAIDVVDSFSVETGKFLRRNPLARGSFLLYLLILHLWTFALLFFHAHSYEGDFSVPKPHSPHVLMQQQHDASHP